MAVQQTDNHHQGIAVVESMTLTCKAVGQHHCCSHQALLGIVFSLAILCLLNLQKGCGPKQKAEAEAQHKSASARPLPVMIPL